MVQIEIILDTLVRIEEVKGSNPFSSISHSINRRFDLKLIAWVSSSSYLAGVRHGFSEQTSSFAGFPAIN